MIDKSFEFKNGILENGINSENKEIKVNKEKEIMKKTEFGISIGHIDYEELGGDSINKNVQNKNVQNNKNTFSNIFKIDNFNKNSKKYYTNSKYPDSDDEYIPNIKNIKETKEVSKYDIENDSEIGGEIIIPSS